MAANPNSARPGVPRYWYLLGMGPMPLPQAHPQDIALARIQGALNGGAFEQPWTRNHDAHPPQPWNRDAHPPPSQPWNCDTHPPQPWNHDTHVAHPPLRAPQQLPAHPQRAAVGEGEGGQAEVVTQPQQHLRLDVHLPYGCGNQKKDDPPVVSILTFDIDDITEEDFLSCVCATVGVDQVKAKLGWKTCDNKKKAAHAFEAHRKMLNNKRREKAVYMEIVNLEKSKEAEKPPPKSSEMATNPDILHKVKNTLQCAIHPGPHWWCYVRRDKGHEGEHVKLGIHEVGLWVQKIHDGEADEDCITPPNVLNFNELTDKTKARSASGSSCGKGINVPDVHVHNYFGASEAGNTPHTTHQDADVPGAANTRILPMKRSHADIPESDDESDLEPICIDNVLRTLHSSMPIFNFPQYKEHLLSNGICYGRSIIDFDQSYYVKKVGMSDGAASEFIRSANQMLGKQKREQGRKKLRLAGKENQSIHCATHLDALKL
ncbi:hypothetical protein BJV78DRAFT_1158199 [Lactifluus subvellereus]|nr:hypothetical protein BJV78DRAFT_1158199 [Lactifluus subvellereus]